MFSIQPVNSKALTDVGPLAGVDDLGYFYDP